MITKRTRAELFDGFTYKALRGGGIGVSFEFYWAF